MTRDAQRVTAPSLDPVLGGEPVVVAPAAGDRVTIDGAVADVRLERRSGGEGVLIEGDTRTVVSIEGDPEHPALTIDGWWIEIAVESDRRAALRERATRAGAQASHGGPTEVRAIIPGRVVSVSVVPGDPVVAGQQLLVVEAMKMQNELRAPRDGTISSVAAAAGGTIEVGDVLLVIT